MSNYFEEIVKAQEKAKAEKRKKQQEALNSSKQFLGTLPGVPPVPTNAAPLIPNLQQDFKPVVVKSQAPRTLADYAMETAKGVMRAPAQGLSQLIDVANVPIGSDFLSGVSGELNRKAYEDYPSSVQAPNSVEDLNNMSGSDLLAYVAAESPQFLASILPFKATTSVAGKIVPRIIKMASKVPGASQVMEKLGGAGKIANALVKSSGGIGVETGSIYGEAKRAKLQNPDLPEPSRLKSLVTGVPAGLLEDIGMEQVLSGVKPSIANTARKTFANMAKEYGWNTVKDMTTEGLTEYAQNLIEDIGAKNLAGTGIIESIKQIIKDPSEHVKALAAGLAGAGGGGMTGAFTNLNAFQQPKQQSDFADAPEVSSDTKAAIDKIKAQTPPSPQTPKTDVNPETVEGDIGTTESKATAQALMQAVGLDEQQGSDLLQKVYGTNNLEELSKPQLEQVNNILTDMVAQKNTPKVVQTPPPTPTDVLAAQNYMQGLGQSYNEAPRNKIATAINNVRQQLMLPSPEQSNLAKKDKVSQVIGALKNRISNMPKTQTNAPDIPSMGINQNGMTLKDKINQIRSGQVNMSPRERNLSKLEQTGIENKLPDKLQMPEQAKANIIGPTNNIPEQTSETPVVIPETANDRTEAEINKDIAKLQKTRDKKSKSMGSMVPPAIKNEVLSGIDNKLSSLQNELENVQNNKAEAEKKENPNIQEYNGSTIYKQHSIGNSENFIAQTDGKYLFKTDKGDFVLVGSQKNAHHFVSRLKAQEAIDKMNTNSETPVTKNGYNEQKDIVNKLARDVEQGSKWESSNLPTRMEMEDRGMTDAEIKEEYTIRKENLDKLKKNRRQLKIENKKLKDLEKIENERIGKDVSSSTKFKVEDKNIEVSAREDGHIESNYTYDDGSRGFTKYLDNFGRLSRINKNLFKGTSEQVKKVKPLVAKLEKADNEFQDYSTVIKPIQDELTNLVKSFNNTSEKPVDKTGTVDTTPTEKESVTNERSKEPSPNDTVSKPSEANDTESTRTRKKDNGKTERSKSTEGGTKEPTGKNVESDNTNKEKIPDNEQTGNREPDKGTNITTGESENKPDKSNSPKRNNPENHRIRFNDTLYASGTVSRANLNIKAIKVLKKLEKENRKATPEEKKTLASFSGWGALANDVIVAKYNDLARNFGTDYGRLRAYGKTQEYVDKYKKWVEKWGKQLNPHLGGMLTEKEWDSAEKATRSSFFTDRDIITNIWHAVKMLGFDNGNVLEPSAGVGHFIGLAPDSIANNSKFYAVEKDSLTGSILEKLYGSSDVRKVGFEESGIKNNSVDLAISNIPFGDFKSGEKKNVDYKDFAIHNYFFAKALDALKPGGLLAFISSTGTMDSGTSKHRKYLSDRAKFLGAIRLPRSAFDKTSGTKTVTDIVFMMKNGEKTTSLPTIDWTDTVETTLEGSKEPVRVNQYFVDNPQMVIGEQKVVKGQFGPTYAVDFKGDLNQALASKIQFLPKEIVEVDHGSNNENTAIFDANKEIAGRAGTYQLDKDNNPVMVTDKGNTEIDLSDYKKKGDKYRVSRKMLTEKQIKEHIKDYIGVRDKVSNLIISEKADLPVKELDSLRSELNKAYDAYVKKHGYINDLANSHYLLDDADFPNFAMLEYLEKNPDTGKKTYEKGDILKRRLSVPFKYPETADTPMDAMQLSIMTVGSVDLGYMSKLLDKPKAEVKKELLDMGAVFENPQSGKLIQRAEYLSGNIVKKIKEAKNAGEGYENNVKELEAVKPGPRPAKDITIMPGTEWVPTRYYEDFIEEFYDSVVRVTKSLSAGKIAFDVKVHNSWTRELTIGNRNMLGVVLKSVLNNKFPTLKTGKQIDTEKTELLKLKIEEMKSRFVDWAKYGKHSKELAKIYNDNIGGIVERKSYIPTSIEKGVSINDNLLKEGRTVESLSKKEREELDKIRFPEASSDIYLRRHQINGVYRALQGNTMLAHAVGTGKTFTFITIAKEMKRLGLAKKPMIVVHNKTMSQYASSFKKIYPSANIIVANEKARKPGKARARLMSDIMSRDVDAVIVPESFFNMLETSVKGQSDYIGNQIDELRDAYLEAEEEEGGHGPTTKQIQNQIEKLEKRLETLSKKGLKVNFPFDNLGVDALLIDEAHSYKRASFTTKLDKVKGIDTNSAGKTLNLQIKLDYLRKKVGERNVVMATGTPISNTAAEAWSFLKHLVPSKLKEYGITSFDGFVNTFGDISSSFEQNQKGTLSAVTRFRGYKNLNDFSKIIRQVFDVVLASDVKIKDTVKMKNGKPTWVEIEQEPEMENFFKFLKNARLEFDSLSGAEKKELGYVPLLISNRAKRASVDLRFIDPNAPDLKNSKTNQAVKNILEIRKKKNKIKGTQFVFCDSRKSKSGINGKVFDIFEDMKAKLIKAGVPENEIAIMGKFSDEKEKEIYDLIRQGKIRVAFGSTTQVGVGVDVARRMSALHHIDIPTRPMDWEQRNGRMFRPDNINAEGEVLVYGMKNSLDSKSFDTLLTKQKFINQALSGNGENTYEEQEDSELTFKELSAIFSGNKDIIKYYNIQKELDSAMLASSATRQQLAQEAFNNQTREKNLKTFENYLVSLNKFLKEKNHDPNKRMTASKDFQLIKNIVSPKLSGKENLEEYKESNMYKQLRENKVAYVWIDKLDSYYKIEARTDGYLISLMDADRVPAANGAVRILMSNAKSTTLEDLIGYDKRNIENGITENKKSIEKYKELKAKGNVHEDKVVKLQSELSELSSVVENMEVGKEDLSNLNWLSYNPLAPENTPGMGIDLNLPFTGNISRATDVLLSGKSGTSPLLDTFNEYVADGLYNLMDSAFRHVGSFVSWLNKIVRRFGTGIRKKASKVWKFIQKLNKTISDAIPGLNKKRGGVMSLRSFVENYKKAVEKLPEKIKQEPLASDNEKVAEFGGALQEGAYNTGREKAKAEAKKITAYRIEKKDEKIKKAKARIEEVKKEFRQKRDLGKEARKELVKMAEKLPPKVRVKVLRKIADADTPMKIGSAINKIDDLFNVFERKQAMKDYVKALKDAKVDKLLPEYRDAIKELKKDGDAKIALEVMQGFMHYLGDDAKMYLSPETKGFIDGLVDNKQLPYLSPESLKILTTAIKTLVEADKRAKALMFGNQLVDVVEKSKEMQTALDKEKQVADDMGHVGFFRWFFDSALMSLENVAEMFGKAGKKIFFDDLNAGERKTLDIWYKGKDALADTLNRLGLKPESKELEDWASKEVEIIDSNGKKHVIPRSVRMNIIANLSDPNTRKEILKAGIKQDKFKNKIELDESAIAYMESKTSAKEQKIIDTMKKFLNSELKKEINSVWVKLAGFEKAFSEHYWPRKRETDPKGFNAGYRQWATSALEHMGIFKERTTSDRAVLIGDIFSTYQKHLKQASTFAGTAIPLRNVEMALGVGGMEKAIEKKLGSKMLKRIKTHMEAIGDLGNPEEGEVNKGMQKFLQNVSVGFLGFNVRSAIKQAGGLFTAATEISGDLLAKNSNKVFSKDIEKKMFKYSSQLRNRYDGVGAKLVNPTFDEKSSVMRGSTRERLIKKAMVLLEKGDQAVTQTIWGAVEDKYSSDRSKMTEDEFYNKVARETEKIVMRTQNVTSKLGMSGLAIESRKNAFLKAAVAFQSQGNAIYNIVRRAIRKYRLGMIQPPELFGILALALMGNAMWSVLVSQFATIKWLKGNKEALTKSDLAAGLLQENIGNVYGGSMASPFVRMVIRSYQKKKVFSGNQMESVTQSVMNDVLGGAAKMMLAPAKDKGKRLRALKKGSEKFLLGLAPAIAFPRVPLKELQYLLQSKK